MASRGIVTLELVEYLGRRTQGLLQEVSPHQGRRAIHTVELLDFLRYVEIGSVIVQFLLVQFLAEDGTQVIHRERLQRGRVQQRSRLVFHVCTHVIPLGGDFTLIEINLVGNFGFHLIFLG